MLQEVRREMADREQRKGAEGRAARAADYVRVSGATRSQNIVS
jgi:hypothetical protein